MEPQPETMRRYYRWQALLYDATRWAFLFGRTRILRQLRNRRPRGYALLLEVGCGTGRNLRWLCRAMPQQRLLGLDVSPDMLRRAERATKGCATKVQLLEQPYGLPGSTLPAQPEAVLFSYALSMFNPGWEQSIAQAKADLVPGGIIAVVDFHDSPLRAFRWWMGKNHVRMDAHLLPTLKTHFATEHQAIRTAWLGLWRYVEFVGQKT
jgi:S-adenosylmethionine-diacylgycerolhomoserine-N-methlytransferase